MSYQVMIIVALSLVAKSMAQCSLPMYDSISAAIVGFDNCMYPTNRFNASCVAASCPALSRGMCPYTSKGAYNISAITRGLSALTSCIQQKKSICNTPIDPIPLHGIGFSINSAFSGLPLNGSCSLVPDTALITSLAQSTFSVSNSQNKLSTGSLLISAYTPNLQYAATMACQIQLTLFGNLFANLTTFTINNIAITVNMNGSYSSLVNPKSSPPKIQILSTVIIPFVNLGNFLPPALLNIFPIQQLISTAIQSFIAQSEMPTVVATFVNTYVANAIAAASRSCPAA